MRPLVPRTPRFTLAGLVLLTLCDFCLAPDCLLYCSEQVTWTTVCSDDSAVLFGRVNTNYPLSPTSTLHHRCCDGFYQGNPVQQGYHLQEYPPSIYHMPPPRDYDSDDEHEKVPFNTPGAGPFTGPAIAMGYQGYPGQQGHHLQEYPPSSYHMPPLTSEFPF
jgi:hypothetical protein